MLPACWDHASSNYGISACVCMFVCVWPSGVSVFHLSCTGEAAHCPLYESRWRCLQVPLSYVSLPGQLLHHRLVCAGMHAFIQEAFNFHLHLISLLLCFLSFYCCTVESLHKKCISSPLLKLFSLSPLLHSGLVRPCSLSHRPSSRMWTLGARSRNRTSQPCAWKYMLVSLTWLSASTQSWDADTTLPLPHTWSSSTSTCPCWRIRGSTKCLWVQPSKCTSSY